MKPTHRRGHPRLCPTCGRLIYLNRYGLYRRQLAVDPDGRRHLCAGSGPRVRLNLIRPGGPRPSKTDQTPPRRPPRTGQDVEHAASTTSPSGERKAPPAHQSERCSDELERPLAPWESSGTSLPAPRVTARVANPVRHHARYVRSLARRVRRRRLLSRPGIRLAPGGPPGVFDPFPAPSRAGGVARTPAERATFCRIDA
jgi:hypothetical protein